MISNLKIVKLCAQFLPLNYISTRLEQREIILYIYVVVIGCYIHEALQNFRFGMKNNLDNILVGIIVQKPLLAHIVDEDFLRTNVENFTSKCVIIIRIVNAHRNEYSMAKVSPLESLSYSKVHSMESSELPLQISYG